MSTPTGLVRPVGADAPVGPGDGRTRAWELLAAGALTTLLSVTLVIGVPSLRHWFMAPVTVGGALIGAEAVRWFRRGTDVLEPRACAGLFGFHFFYLVPVLTVANRTWGTDYYNAPDWPEAIGALSVLNVVGLCVYRLVLDAPGGPPRQRRPGRILHLRTFYLVGAAAAALSMALFFGYQVRSFGGFPAFVAAMTNRADPPDLTRLGSILLVSQAFPLLVYTLALVRWRDAFARGPVRLTLLLAGLVVAQFFVAGLGGSRSSTLWPLLLALVMAHLVVRRLSRRALLVPAVLILVFLYGAGFFKAGGVDSIREIRQTGSVSQAESATGRSLPLLLTGDLGRTDVQALVLHRLLSGQMEPELGTTYLAPVRLWLPNSIAPLDFETKRDVGSRWLYNPLFGRGERNASKVYGMAGEGMINFGLLGGVLSFAVYGLIIRLIGRLYRTARTGTALVPQIFAAMAWGLTIAVNADLGNLIDFNMKFTVPVVLLVLLSSARSPAGPPAPDPAVPLPHRPPRPDPVDRQRVPH
ncbi:O-antigen polymerase [Micromonospora sp. NPDC050980]|uniref:O-antigen polymerase n=1 Tax=Micromonospora sp. NPDC050980 TaxID=3155161 RepID=UPI0033CFEB67